MLKKRLFKIDRIVVWPLLFVTIIYLLSGYSMTYRFSAYKIIPQSLASSIHAPFCFAFLILFLLHSLIAIYFAILRPPSKPHLSIRLSRWSGWLLFVSVSIMMVSGYSMMGILPAIPAIVQLHSTFSFLVIPLFIVHAGINAYFMVRKWVKS